MRARILSGSAKQVDYHERVQKFLPDSLRYTYSSHRQTFNPPTNTSNSVTFHFGSKMFQTSYTIFGNLKYSTRPLVVLNGGSCISHTYMLPHANLYKTHCQPAVPYDRLGADATSPRNFSRLRSSSPSCTTSSGTSASAATLTCSGSPGASRLDRCALATGT